MYTYKQTDKIISREEGIRGRPPVGGGIGTEPHSPLLEH